MAERASIPGWNDSVVAVLLLPAAPGSMGRLLEALADVYPGAVLEQPPGRRTDLVVLAIKPDAADDEARGRA